MAVAVGIGPAQVLELDAPTFEALEAAIAARWTPELELAATTAELVSAQLSAFVAAHSSGRNRKVPEVLRVPRPGDPSSSSSSTAGPRTVRVTPSQHAAMLGRGRVVPVVKETGA